MGKYQYERQTFIVYQRYDTCNKINPAMKCYFTGDQEVLQ